MDIDSDRRVTPTIDQRWRLPQFGRPAQERVWRLGGRVMMCGKDVYRGGDGGPVLSPGPNLIVALFRVL